jgi:hypothetical protein
MLLFLIPEATGLTSTETLTLGFFVAGKEVGQVKLSRKTPKFGLVSSVTFTELGADKA